MATTRIPIWLDCDPGHDDAFAILLAAYHPDIELLGISTVFGNASIQNTTRNASSVLTAIGKRHISVHQGASKALVRPALYPPTDIHGISGIDGTSHMPPPLAPIISPSPSNPTPAVSAMAAALSSTLPQTAWIVATGALTNLAVLFAHHPHLAAHVAGVSSMAGAIGGGFTDAVLGPPVDDGKGGRSERIGNWTPWAEWNVLADPEAARDVLESEALRGKIILVPLDLTHQAMATPGARDLLLWGPGGRDVGKDGAGGGKKSDGRESEGEKRKEGKAEGKTMLRTMFVELLMFFAQTYDDVFNITSPPLHDPLAVAAVLADTEHGIAFHDWDTRRSDPDSDPPRSTAATATSDSAPIQTRAERKARLPEGPREPERFRVSVVTEGTHAEATRTGGPQTGRTLATLLPPSEPGVKIPRWLDVGRFWIVLEECMERADRANATAEEA